MADEPTGNTESQNLPGESSGSNFEQVPTSDYVRDKNGRLRPGQGLYRPKEGSSTGELLYLDCTINKLNIVQNWYNRMLLALTLNKELSETDGLSYYNFVLYKTTGNVHRYLISRNNHIGAFDNAQVLRETTRDILQEFCGIKWVPGQAIAEMTNKDVTKHVLTNIQ